MAKSDQFNIIVAVNDDSLTYQITSKIKQKFKELPLNIIVAADGPSALVQSKNLKPHLIIVSATLVGMNGAQVIREIRKSDGGISFIYLYDHNDQPIQESGVNLVQTPISNWHNFHSKIQEVIPEEIKIKFGLLKGDGVLHRMLKEYSDKFCEENNILSERQAYQKERPVVMIHNSYDTFSNTGNVLANTGKATHEEQDQKLHGETHQSEKSPMPKTIWLEIIILVVLTGVCLYYFKQQQEMEESAGFFNIKNLFASITVLSYFGFFLSRGIDRILQKMPKSE